MIRTRVLVVDDSDVTRAVLTRTLEQAGFEVRQAKDGVEGAVMALQEQFAAVITDLEMPMMDGFQLLRLLKNDPANTDLPVLIMTSHGEAPSRFWGQHAGADAYLTKDHDASELVAAVTRLARKELPAAPPISSPPAEAMDVFARVVRQLDTALMETTLASSLLERGFAESDYLKTTTAALKVIAEVVDAHALATAFSESHATTLNIFLPQGLTEREIENVASSILETVPVTAGATVDVTVTGTRLPEGGETVGQAVPIQLPLRDAAGSLMIFPRDAAQYAAVSHHLVERMARQLALVLDNARLAQRLRELSMLDGLTRVLNHRAIHERLIEELERARRYGNTLSVVLCDLDRFKIINDTHGHLAGDAVLRGVARVIRRGLRGPDALGRYGGEEFLLVLPESDLLAARRAAERLRESLAQSPLPLPTGESVTVTGSFGVAAHSELANTPGGEALVSLADRRLYEAKAAGRNRVRP